MKIRTGFVSNSSSDTKRYVDYDVYVEEELDGEEECVRERVKEAFRNGWTVREGGVSNDDDSAISCLLHSYRYQFEIDEEDLKLFFEW